MTYRYESKTVDPEAPGAAELLEQLHAVHARLSCVCTEPAPLMYLARAGKKIIVKRMPDTGGDHAPTCDSYEPPAELSGRGEVAGRAIREDENEGTTKLRLAFSLAKTGTRAKAEEDAAAGASPDDGAKEAESVKTQGSKLTLQALVHYLWEEARFNVWTPAMTGKRTWRVVRHHLLETVSGKGTSTTSLSEAVFMPEPFVLDDKAGIAARRDLQLAGYQLGKGGKGRLGMLIGEVKEIGDSRFGGKAVIKHMPDMPFLLPKDLYKSLLKKFDTALGLFSALPDTHLMLVATFGMTKAGYPEVQEAALLNFNVHWLPFESRHEHMLLEEVHAAGRRMVKGMRYNMPPAKPLATIVLTDCKPTPVALYVVPVDASDQYHTELDELRRGSKLRSWVWRMHEARPPLPEVEGYDAQPADVLQEASGDR